MRVRHPEFDFTATIPHWTSNIELAQSINASNLIPAGVEPFLIKVLRRAKTLLEPERDAELLADMDIFCKQEGQHMKMHSSFLTMMHENGYEGAIVYEEAYEDDYGRWLNQRSLRFLLAYCEGFEALGSAIADIWVDGAYDDLLSDADPIPQALWKWHLAEEFEHRTVVFRLYQRLYGKPILLSWPYRVFGFVFCVRHIHRHTARLRAFLMEQDRARMSPREVEQSIRREKAVDRSQRAFAHIGGLLRVLSPTYNPAKLAAPRCIGEVLDQY